MKLSLYMMFVVLWQVSASTYSQETKLKLNMRNASVKQVFKAIKTQSEFTFIFNEEDIANVKTVSLSVNDETVESVLSTCLENSGLTWQVIDDVIIIKPANKVIQQEIITVKGRVTDDKGLPIPGVNIVVVNYNNGTISDADGYYELRVPDSSVSLSYTFIGFVKQTIALEGRTEVNVQLETEVSEIGDVVVTGYFNQTKESFTGSAVTISADELIQASNQNILQSIQLVDPAFMMVENSLEGSNPNAMPEFQIRGSASVDMQGEFQGEPNMPTFILDGFEVNVEKVYDLDPYRVRSVTILKDAAATAIYGSRAANGVVVIETLAPEGGKMAVNYKGDFTFTGADLSDYDLLNATEKLELELAAGLYEGAGLVSNFEDAQHRYNEKLKLVQQGYNTYWLNKPVETTAISHKHSLLLEGGNDQIRYGIDLNYNDQNGIMKESGRDRMGIGIKLQYTYNNLVLRNKFTYDNVKAINSPYGAFSTYAKLNPYYRYKNDIGEYEYMLEKTYGTVAGQTLNYVVYNPLYNTTLNTIDESKYDDLINNFDIDWRINDDFRLKGSLSLNKRINTSDVFKPGVHTDFAGESDINKKGSYNASRGESISWETNIVFNYFKQINKHVINANGIFNANQQHTESMSVMAQGFPNEDMDNIDFAIQYEADGKPNGSEYTSRLVGISGNINYSFDNRYLMDLSYRTDGSSAFGTKKRWAPFWAVGAGWNLHNEAFIKDSNLINDLKIRGSYGSTGSVDFNPYQAMMMYNYRTDLIHRFEAGATLMALGNENLSWQQTLKRNLGLDLAMFNNRLSATFNYYNDISENLLVDIDLAPSLGFSQYKENLGESRNEGYELSLRYDVLKNKSGFRWSVYGNAVHNENTLLKLSDSLEEFNARQDEEITDPEDGKEYLRTRPRVRYVEGQSMNAIWANKSLGIDPATGKEIFVTKDGGTSLVWDVDNMMVCGDSSPDVFGNFGTNVSYKGFLLNVVFRYRIGGQYYNQTLVDRVENADPAYNTDRRVLEARWENPGDMTFYKDVKDSELTKPTSRFIQDYSYLEFATINASYEFNSKVAQKVGMKRLKALFYMNDAFRASTVRTERGINYPFARSFSLGIQARF
ncbi:SusC/RagA family TonB-linked outer membrane protein [Carboxylicivirga sp. A043]|uniref:SusC/RagA family TonB-linked outer membrane protein n=1 Tax=Carboxylicivirga litoralis TaxID=2816963 RepID=UPI0021CB7A3A|nr:SusC/RagA family TonB-linked outer membrane protein [Carboxylicivirga sp. A043]MCU4156326.1 SusC/RagA family TonB-linked outer membrane protein [Carboxylicivirga sp. A043]